MKKYIVMDAILISSFFINGTHCYAGNLDSSSTAGDIWYIDVSFPGYTPDPHCGEVFGDEIGTCAPGGEGYPVTVSDPIKLPKSSYPSGGIFTFAGVVLENAEYAAGDNIIYNSPGCPPTFELKLCQQVLLGLAPDGSNNGICGGGNNGDGGSNGVEGSCEKYLPNTVGEPVNVATGNMYHEQTDFQFSDLLKLTRTYNSYGDTFNNVTGYTPRFGNKWSFNFGTNLASFSGGIRILASSGKWRSYGGSVSAGYLPYPGTNGNIVYSSGTGGYTETLYDGTVNIFDSQGRLIRTVTPTGRFVTLDYSQANYIKVSDEFGRYILFHLNSSGYIDHVTDPSGRIYQYGYTGNDLTSVTFPDGSVKTYTYQSPDLLTSITLNGQSLAQWSYDSNNYCTSSSIDGVNNLVALSYNTPATGETTVTNSRNNSTVYTFQNILGIKKTGNVAGNCGCTTASATYDSAGNISSRTDKHGNITRYSNYDARGNPGVIMEAYSTINTRTRYFVYNPNTGAPALITQKSAIPFGGYSTYQQTFVYDGNNRLIASYKQGNTQDINGNPEFVDYSTSYSYNSHSQIVQKDDALGRRTIFGYYSTTYGNPDNGQLQTVTKYLDGAPSVTTFGNYSSGKAGWKIAQDNAVTDYVYDLRGRLLTSTEHTPAGKIRRTSYGYDAFGNVTSYLSPKGARYGMSYDSDNRLTEIRDALGNDISYGYDTESNIVTMQVYDSSGNLKQSLQRRYNADNRLSGIVFGAYSSTIGYDGNGNITAITDYLDHVTNLGYDALDRVNSLVLPPPSGTGPGISSSAAYDINDKPVTVTDGKQNSTDRVYDDFGRLVQTTDAESRVTRREYDAAGNLVKLRDPAGNVTGWQYDDFNLPETKTYADGHINTFTYNLDGTMHTKTNARGIIKTYTYDGDELTGVTYSDGVTPAVSYMNDPNYKRVASRTDGAGTWNYTYDANGRIHSVAGPWNDTTTYGYDTLGRIASEQVQGYDASNYVYDMLGRLSTVTTATRTFFYSYSGMNPLPASLSRPNGSVTHYTYDNIYRLSSISNQNSAGQVLTSNAFKYNNAHMITQETIFNNVSAVLGNSVKTYTYNNLNQITSSGYAYDADGNMTNGYTPDGYAFTASYDAENRLTNISYTDSNNVTHTASFIYSADNMIAKQVVDGVETRFVRDINFNNLQERDANNNVTRSYVWNPTAPGGIGGLLEMTQGGSQYDYLYDGKGNVSAVIDANQSIVASYAYNPFGRLLAKSGTLDQPYQFSTKPYYEGYGVVYYGYRFYNPTSMKWMTRDPAGEKADENLYRTMGNSAINFIDPYGRSWSSFWQWIKNFSGGVFYALIEEPASEFMQLAKPETGSYLISMQVYDWNRDHYPDYQIDPTLPPSQQLEKLQEMKKKCGN